MSVPGSKETGPGWRALWRVAVLAVSAGADHQAAAETVTPVNLAEEAALACDNRAPDAGTGWGATFASNVAEVVFAPVGTDRYFGLTCVSIDGTVTSGNAPTGMIAWSESVSSSARQGTAIRIDRLSGGVYATGVTNAFGILAWSDTTFATNPAAVTIGKCDGTVSANVAPGGLAVAFCARTAVEVALGSGALLFGGTYGWDAGDGSATNAAAVLQALLAKVKARTASPAESNALAAASSAGYAILGGSAGDTVRYGPNVTVYGKIALGDGYDTVSLSGLASGARVTLPPVTGAELLAVTNSPDVTVSNATVYADLFVGSNTLCRLKDSAYTFAGLYGRGTLVPQGTLSVTNRIEVGGFGEAPVGARLAVTGGLTLGAGVTCALRAAVTDGLWTNDTVSVSGVLTVAGSGAVDLRCTPEAPLAAHTKRIVMSAAGGIVNPGWLGGWSLVGTGRDEEKGLIRTVRAEGNNIVAIMSVGGTLITIF